MSTRGLLTIVSDNEFKFSFFIPCDAYPSYSGVRILKFIKNKNLDKLERRVREIKLLPWPENNTVDPRVDISIRTAKGALKCLYKTNQEYFYDSLPISAMPWCEFAYVIDLDERTFEMHYGRNSKHQPNDEHQRFPSFQNHHTQEEADKGWHPPRLIKSYSLGNLPKKKKLLEDYSEFIDAMYPD